MVLYFSGTGNSKYVAQRISEKLGDALTDMNTLIKNDTIRPIETGESVIVVAPTYAWRIPSVVKKWLANTLLIGAKQAWFVMTCGDSIGNADKYNRKLCKIKGIQYMGTAKVRMPENYIAMYDAPKAEKARHIVEKSEPNIDAIIESIANKEPFFSASITFNDRFLSSTVNAFFYPFCVKSKAFTATEKCIGCGKCAALCPLNNIKIASGKPVWGNNCTHCMACICYCPSEAIEYGKISMGKVRYNFEGLDYSKK